MATVLAAALSLLSGYLLTDALDCRRATLSALLLKLSLATGFGLGISSVVFFLARMGRTEHFVRIDLLFLAAICVFYRLVRFRSHPSIAPEIPIPDISLLPRLRYPLVAAFLVTFVAAI